MSTEEESTPAALPPYPELILEAIDGLNEKGGSSKSAISNYIESHRENLPEDHVAQVAEHLGKMKDANELTFAKNNYSRPDPDAPPKRGRGRPPKPKAPLPPTTFHRRQGPAAVPQSQGPLAAAGAPAAASPSPVGDPQRSPAWRSPAPRLPLPRPAG
ncbi:unnamed protein product [Spirodela intermedia]|uniref:H15 domain-containing protein n=1 Tax=Spirodela intermedia TaxID=51605 RepID=A0A7I8J4J6_SPIIN|nr:unnamed protein product [Spirodela intermedia]CAA6664290.1 unnamed protein product [Spirodela intermedia]